jgi:uncharacterized membrane protein YbhN (UPF0104 family)
VLAWVATQIDWRGFAGLRGLDWPLAVAACLLAGAAYPLQAWRWQKLLAAQQVPLAPARVHALFWIGNFYNSFLPGGVAGDGVRLFATWREFPQHKAAAAASIVADRLLGLGALLALAVLALGGQLATAGTQGELEAILLASAGALALLAAGTALVTHTRFWDPFAVRWLGVERAAGLRAAADALAQNQSALLAATGLSVAVWLLDFAALWLLAGAVGLTTDPLAMTVAAAAAYVAASLPISIGGHGVREGTLVLVLGWLGVGAETPERVTLLALAFWAVSTFWSLAGALALLIERRTRP